MIRKAVVAGMFYESDEEGLREQIKACFKDGPGEVVDRKDKQIIGVIAPHAGYQFSGAGQAFCYKEIAESEKADVYIILGTSHVGFSKAAVSDDDFETPLGVVKVDKEIISSLVDKNVVVENNEVHLQEHSIEVQLPFLQFISDDFKIVPIVVGGDIDYEKIGKGIAEVIKESGKKVKLICSSDFTHYGISYGYLPFKDNIKENLSKLDLGAIEWIKKLDVWSFMDYVNEKKATICGKGAISCFIVACKELGAVSADLENYFSSGEVSGDWVNAVGYASIIVEK